MFRLHMSVPLRLCVIAALLAGIACSGQPPEPPPAVAREAQWTKVGEWSGRGNAQLETFPIERFTWRVRWETKNENPPGSGTFHVTANSGDSGRILAEVANFKGVGRDTTFITELPHRYYFVVESKGVDWTLIAEEVVQQQ
jgi:hypothetical protein